MDVRSTRPYVDGLLAASLLATGLLPSAGCSQLPREATPASAAQTAAAHPPGTSITTPPHMPSIPTTPGDTAHPQQQAGVPVSNTQVQVPRKGFAGRPLRIHAPPGSRVTVRDTGRVEIVPNAGVLDLATPQARGPWRLRVQRPDGGAMPFIVELD